MNKKIWNDGPDFERHLEPDFAPAVALRNICSGKGGGGGYQPSGQTQTVTNKVELPPWVDKAAQANYEQASAVSQNLAGPYTGPRVAGMTPGLVTNINALQDNAAMTQPAYAYGQNVAAGVANADPGTIAGSDLSQYMNPYANAVLGTGLQALDVQRQQALNQGADQAIRARAFGGSRHGVQEGVTNAGAATQAANFAANVQQQNFAQAQQAAQQDVANRMGGAQLNLQGAQTLGALAGAGQQSFLSGTNAALQGQVLAQQQQQAQLDAAQQAYHESQQFPLQQLQVKMAALGMSPYGQTTTQTSPIPGQYGGNPFMQTMGGISSGLGILGSGASLLGALFSSDRRDKTDIKKLGKDEVTGLNLYAYRYKGDPKSYPKVVGPMAQDIAKAYPGSVADVGGHKVVNLGFG